MNQPLCRITKIQRLIDVSSERAKIPMTFLVTVRGVRRDDGSWILESVNASTLRMEHEDGPVPFGSHELAGGFTSTWRWYKRWLALEPGRQQELETALELQYAADTKSGHRVGIG